MKTIKLSEWCDRSGIKYLTAYRWFKTNKMPVSTYQTQTGTILVEDGFEGEEMKSIQSSEIISSILKKTVELSKNNGTIDEFASWILSNFTLKSINSEAPRYTRNKPKPEEVQKHFGQFLKPKGEKPKSNIFIAEEAVLDELIKKSDNMTTQELVNEVYKAGLDVGVSINPSEVAEVTDLMKDMAAELKDDFKGSPEILDSTDSTDSFHRASLTSKEVADLEKLTKKSKSKKVKNV